MILTTSFVDKKLVELYNVEKHFAIHRYEVILCIVNFAALPLPMTANSAPTAENA